MFHSVSGACVIRSGFIRWNYELIILDLGRSYGKKQVVGDCTSFVLGTVLFSSWLLFYYDAIREEKDFLKNKYIEE